MAAPASARPELGDILLVIHDFIARSSDELSLAKGDRVELQERDDEFGDGWFFGRHLVSNSQGLFPEVYTRPIPSKPPAAVLSPKVPLSPLSELVPEYLSQEATPTEMNIAQPESTPVTLPLNSTKLAAVSNGSAPGPGSGYLPAPASSGAGLNSYSRPSTSQDSHVLNETLNVIDKHITDLKTPQASGSLRTPADSSSEYSSNIDHRMSYIQGEETDEEEETAHSRAEVETWSAEQVAEYLFTNGVEKHHCEVFRDQEITGEVLLGMDQASAFIKALDLGSVGRRLKTWQKIKSLQHECNGMTSPGTLRSASTFGSDAGSETAGRVRSRADTVTSARYAPSEGRGSVSLKTRRQSQTPKMEPAQPLTPVSPISALDSQPRPPHEKRLSAASVRDMSHSRRHSSTEYRLTGAVPPAPVPPKAPASASFSKLPAAHKKQPSFDRNWTMGSALSRPPSMGMQDDLDLPIPLNGVDDARGRGRGEAVGGDSAVDLDRGYFSGPDGNAKRRSLLKRTNLGSPRSPKMSHTEELRTRSGTAMSRHPRFGSIESMRDSAPAAATPASPASQKYYGLGSGVHKRTASAATSDSYRPPLPSKDFAPPAVTKLDTQSSEADPSPRSSRRRLSQINHPDFHVNALFKGGFGLRAASDAIASITSGGDRSKMASPSDSPPRESPMYSPIRTGSSTPSAGPSFEFDPPADGGKSPSTTHTAASRGSRKKTKQETSAYTRGLLKMGPREAIVDADYSGWMKKKSSNLMTTWKPRLFVLKGRRLAYYYSEDDDQEKGLIDISFHRVLPADNERLTGLHATLTGASNTPVMPAGSNMMTASASADADNPALSSKDGGDQMFIFKLVPPRAGLSRAVNFTKPTVHYFAVPNIKQGRLWMAALMKATIDRDDLQPITTTYQQKTISLSKARQMRHRPPALMNLDENVEDSVLATVPMATDGRDRRDHDEGNASFEDASKTASNGLGILYSDIDSGVSGLEKLTSSLHLGGEGGGRTKGGFLFAEPTTSMPQSA